MKFFKKNTKKSEGKKATPAPTKKATPPPTAAKKKKVPPPTTAKKQVTPVKKSGPTPQQQEKMKLEKEIRALKEEKSQLLKDGGLSEESWQKLIDYCFFLIREKGLTYLEMKDVEEACQGYAEELRKEQEVAAFTEERRSVA